MVNTHEYHSRWENMWADGIDHGEAFDAYQSAPVLVELLQSDEGQALCKGKSAVVPGCGRGYDLVTFAKHGASKVVGFEISESAAAVARAYTAAQPDSAAADVSVEVADWLDPSSGSASDVTFDVGYDYTFFCALHPDMRRAWAEGWARRLRSGGTLLALAFPIEEKGREGPPWPLQVSDYEEALVPCGFRCIKLEPVVPEKATQPKRAGREILTVWVKE
eukprot:jgi/Ulvmu1/651/UM010_0022.1